MPKVIRTATVMLAAVMLSCSAEGLANTGDIPASFQGRWRGTSCAVEAAFTGFPAEIVNLLKLSIQKSLLTVTPTSFTRPPSNLARMTNGTEVKANPISLSLSTVLRQLNIQTPVVLGKPVIFKNATVLKGVSLKAGTCMVAPHMLVARPGEPRPSGDPVASTTCYPVLMFHYPDINHVAIPSDGIVGCVEIFERVPDAKGD